MPATNKNISKIKAIDFFCGVGGATRGFMDAGIDVLCGIDIDSSAKATFEKNNIRQNGKPVRFIKKDILKLTFQEIQNLLAQETYDKLFFIGCAPCQPFTNIKTIKNKREQENTFLLRFGDFIQKFKPDYIFIENVPGIDSTKYGNILSEFKKRLQDSNYYFLDKNINAKYFGIPQNRNRRILIASPKEEICFPKETNNKDNFVTVRKVFLENKLEKLNAGEISNTDELHRAAKLSSNNLWRIKNTPEDGGGRDIWMKKKPINCFQQRKGAFKDVYNRMFWDKPSPTITTRFNSLSNGRFGHPDEDRAISLREGAILQTFPKDYVFFGSSTTIAKHIGNAVPVQLAKTFGKHFIEI